MKLEAGAYTVEWFDINTRVAKELGKQIVDSNGSDQFTLPFTEAGPAVLYLKRVGD